MRMSATEKVPTSHSLPSRTVSICLSRASRKESKNFRIGVSSVSPENMKKDQGWLAASTEASAANSHSLASLRPRRSAGQMFVDQGQFGAAVKRLKQKRDQ